MASFESGANLRVTLRRTFPSTTLVGGKGWPATYCPSSIGITESTPGLAFNFAIAGCVSASFKTTCVG